MNLTNKIFAIFCIVVIIGFAFVLEGVQALLFTIMGLTLIGGFSWKGWILIQQFRDQYFFDRQLEKWEYDASINNKPISPDKAVEKFLANDTYDHSEGLTEYNEMFDKYQEMKKAKIEAEEERAKYEEEARYMKEQCNYMQEQLKYHREGTKLTMHKTSDKPFKVGPNVLLNYDGDTWLIFNNDRGGIVGRFTFVSDDKTKVHASAYRKTIISPPTCDIWEKVNAEEDYDPVYIEEIDTIADLIQGLDSFHFFQTYKIHVEHQKMMHDIEMRQLKARQEFDQRIQQP